MPKPQDGQAFLKPGDTVELFLFSAISGPVTLVLKVFIHQNQPRDFVVHAHS